MLRQAEIGLAAGRTIGEVVRRLGISEQTYYRWWKLYGGMRVRVVRVDEDTLTRAIVNLSTEYGRYGYRCITALLMAQGWHVNAKRVQRIWRW